MTVGLENFFIMAGVFVLIALSLLIWVLYIRKSGRRHRRKHLHPHRRERRSINPTLAEVGGLPPSRPPNSPEPPPTQSP